MSQAIQLLIGTRKGAWTLRSDPRREAWTIDGPLFLGQIVNHYVRIFVGQDEAKIVAAPVAEGGELLIFGALSGG